MLKRNFLEKEYKFLGHCRVIRLISRHFNLLEVGLFKGLNSLEVINLSKNEINSINQELVCLRNLKELQLSYNRISDYLTEDMFIGLTNLTKVDLSFNQISKVNDKTFNRLLNLRSINLSHNQIESIQKPFEMLLNLESIDMSCNKLAVIGQCAFKGLTALKKINLLDNKLSQNKKLALYLEDSVQLVMLQKHNESFINNINLISNRKYFVIL